MVNVGFIGLGNMGLPIAEKIGKNIPLKVFDIDHTKILKLENKNLLGIYNVKNLAKECDILFTCLPSSEEVDNLLFGDYSIVDHLTPGTTIIDMTSGDPNLTRKFSLELSKMDIEIIDAPVSGGPKAAYNGTISIIVGGTNEQFERISPILSYISKNIMHAGGLGNGHAMKAGNNLLNLICRLATYEITSVLIKEGIKATDVISIIQKSSGRNYTTEVTIPDNILSGKMHQGFTTGLMQKDSAIALSVAKENQTETPIGKLAFLILDEIISDYGIDADMSNLALRYEKNTGVQIRPNNKHI